VGGELLCALMEAECVTYAAGVPTVWQRLLDHMSSHGLRFSRLQHTVIGGSVSVDRNKSVIAWQSIGAASRVHADIITYVQKSVRKGWGGSQGTPIVLPVAAPVSSGVG
jgi:acyl-CoA synthetase (AMP-forming)/AMP-acid ligase II